MIKPNWYTRRKHILKALIDNSIDIRDVPLSSRLASLFQIYGLRKLLLKKAMRCVDYGDVQEVTIEGRSIYWPSSASARRLLDMYFEVFKGNCHRFDTCGTELRKGDVVIDVGCCEGYFALRAIEQHASKVLCFEPGKSIGNCLAKTFKREIKESKIEIISKLLGDTNNEFKFHEDPEDPTTGCLVLNSSPSTSPNEYHVEMTTLDMFYKTSGLEKLDYIKIDAEGAEPEIIEGAREVIDRYHPRIAVAVYHAPHHAQQLRKIISDINHNYRFHLKGLIEFDGIVRPVMLHCFVPVTRE